MVVLIEEAHCDKCDKTMKYDMEGNCVKCGTFIFKNLSIQIGGWDINDELRKIEER